MFKFFSYGTISLQRKVLFMASVTPVVTSLPDRMPSVPATPSPAQEREDFVTRCAAPALIIVAITFGLASLGCLILSFIGVVSLWGAYFLCIIIAIVCSLFASFVRENFHVSEGDNNRRQGGSVSSPSRPSSAAVQAAFQAEQPGVGIQNGGNTCFANAALQAVFADPVMYQAIREGVENQKLGWENFEKLCLWLRKPEPKEALAEPDEILNSLINLFAEAEFQHEVDFSATGQ